MSSRFGTPAILRVLRHGGRRINDTPRSDETVFCFCLRSLTRRNAAAKERYRRAAAVARRYTTRSRQTRVSCSPYPLLAISCCRRRRRRRRRAHATAVGRRTAVVSCGRIGAVCICSPPPSVRRSLASLGNDEKFSRPSGRLSVIYFATSFSLVTVVDSRVVFSRRR